MSEYWVSKKKYWCTYCEIFIADDAPSRAQHENGLRHKGNKDRYIRSLYKTSIKTKQDAEEEKREMKRVEEAARVAYARDVGSGREKPVASSSSLAAPAPTTKPKAPPKPSDPYTNYTTAASLGINDPEVERSIAEAKARQSEGRAGEWVPVVPPPPPLVPEESTSNSAYSVADVKTEPGETASQVRKRVADTLMDEEDTRQFKLRKKTVTVGLGEIYDPGIIQVKPKIKLETSTDVSSKPGDILDAGLQISTQPTGNETSGTMGKPKWVTRGWKRAVEPASENAESLTGQNLTEDVKPNRELLGAPSEVHATSGNDSKSSKDGSIHEVEEAEHTGEANKQELLDEVKKEELNDIPIPVGTAGLFRKRKMPAGSAAGRRKDR